MTSTSNVSGAAASPRPQRGRGLGEGDSPQTRLLKLARALRINATDAEQLMWDVLRDRQVGGYKFRRQHRVLGILLTSRVQNKSSLLSWMAASIIHKKASRVMRNGRQF
jgi:Protein of unknown function (DUF559)